VSESLLSLPETEEDEVDSETECESDYDDTDSAFVVLREYCFNLEKR